MPRMRTAGKVYELIREQDPDTEVTPYFIRQLIRTGKIPVTPVGRKKLVDADAVIAYIAAGEEPTTTDSPTKDCGKIRRITL